MARLEERNALIVREEVLVREWWWGVLGRKHSGVETSKRDTE